MPETVTGEQWTQTISRVSSWAFRRTVAPESGLHDARGIVETPHGIVFVNSFELGNGESFTVFNFVYQGTGYTLRQNEVRASRGAAIVAGRWVREIMAAERQRRGEE